MAFANAKVVFQKQQVRISVSNAMVHALSAGVQVWKIVLSALIIKIGLGNFQVFLLANASVLTSTMMMAPVPAKVILC